MPKSYVPQLLFMTRALLNYINKHQETIFKYVTDPSQQEVITNCLPCLQAVLTTLSRPAETP